MRTTELMPAYPATCPSCGKQEGLPIGATVGAAHGAVIVDVRCRACQSHWAEQLPKPSPAKANNERPQLVRRNGLRSER
jgi:hypothetical protein